MYTQTQYIYMDISFRNVSALRLEEAEMCQSQGPEKIKIDIPRSTTWNTTNTVIHPASFARVHVPWALFRTINVDQRGRKTGSERVAL